MATKTQKKDDQAVNKAEALEIEQREKITESKKMIPKDIDPHQFVTVRNGSRGPLIYKSKRTGETYKWAEFGDPQDMELGELKNAKSSNKKFFENNWFMFDEPWVIEYLGLKQYYKFAIDIEAFDMLFQKPADEVEKSIQKLTMGQKRTVAYRARQLIEQEQIDSNKLIAVLERCLGVELVEK